MCQTVDTLMSQFEVEEKGFSPPELKALILHQNISKLGQGKTDLGRTHLTLHETDTGDALRCTSGPHSQQEVTDKFLPAVQFFLPVVHGQPWLLL